MTIYSIIYVSLVLILIIQCAKNRLDLLCVAEICYAVYSLYCAFGIGLSGAYSTRLSPILYTFVFIQICIITVFTFLIRKRKVCLQVEKNDQSSKNLFRVGEIQLSDRLTTAYFIYTIIIAVFALVNILRIGISGLAAGKANVWNETNVFYVISLYGTYPSFAYGIHKGVKIIWIPAVLIELTVFFAGSRAFFTTMIIIFLCEKGSELWKKRKSNLKIAILGLLGIVFLLIYRSVDQLIMAGDFGGVLHTLSDPATWLEALEFNEPRVIIANYDYILQNHFRLPFQDTLYRIIDFVPGATSIVHLNIRYDEYFSEVIRSFVGAVRGVGSSIWGECYAMFGIVGIPLCTILWLCFINCCNNHLDYHSDYSYFIVSIGAYLAWYINRLDFNLVAQACKVMLFCFLIWACVYLVLGGSIKMKKTRLKI